MISSEDSTKAKREVLNTLGVLLAAALFAWFIWPTRYERGERRIGQAVYPIRIHRISRRVEMQTDFGWELVGSAPDPDPTGIPPRELAKVTLKCAPTPFVALECEVLNNSDWSLSEITLTVRVLNEKGTEARRFKYEMAPDLRPYFDPGGSGKGFVQIDSSLDPGQTLSWTVDGARGVKSP
jgi:hypothetical protein